MTAVDPDVLGRAEITAMDALIDSGLSRQVRGDGNTLAAVVSAVLAAAAPILTGSTSRAPTFEDLLSDPMAQLDPRSELLPLLLEHMQETGPPDPAASGHGAEAYRHGYPPAVTFGWQCLVCNIDVDGLGAPAAAERAASAHNATYDTPADTITAAVRAFQITAWPALQPDADVPRIRAGVEAAYHVIAGAVTERNASTAEELCHWVQRIGNARSETHREFHFGFTCPYEAAAAVLRGQTDPRGTTASNEVAKPEPGTGGTR